VHAPSSAATPATATKVRTRDKNIRLLGYW
jgi:hypothetical protein